MHQVQVLALVAVGRGFPWGAIIWALGMVGIVWWWRSGWAAVAVVGLVCALAACTWVPWVGCIAGVDCKARSHRAGPGLAL